MTIKYCKVCGTVMKYQVQPEVYQCVMVGCESSEHVDTVDVAFLNIHSKTFETQFNKYIIKKYYNDDIVKKSEKDLCPKCGDFYRFLITGGNDTVDRICNCTKEIF